MRAYPTDPMARDECKQLLQKTKPVPRSHNVAAQAAVDSLPAYGSSLRRYPRGSQR